MKHDFLENMFWTDQYTGHQFGVFTEEFKIKKQSARGSFYGIVLSGACVLNDKNTLEKGDFFSKSNFGVDEPVLSITKVQNYKLFVIHVPEYRCQTINSGTIDDTKGRLRYIDGCTDSLLICPVKKGEPCLNALYFPEHISQTYHTHPSYRAGCVLDGAGKAYYSPTGKSEDAEIITLVSGTCFFLPAGQLHRFETTKERLVNAAFHPDSDFGPEDEDHPMLNRTMIDDLNNKEKLGLTTQS